MRSYSLEGILEHSSVKVLLVDDDQDSYLLTRRMLNKIDGAFQIDWASSFESGLESVARHAHDVYLFDYRLGAHNGLELLRQALGIGCKKPIIMLTTENPEVDAEAMRLGAADFLNKERLDASLLERSIRYSIKQFATLRALRESQAQLGSFMQNVPCALYMKDLQGRYVYVNGVCEKLFDRPALECTGKNDEELWHKSAAQKHRETDHKVATTRKALETTETIAKADGLHYWLATRFPILNEQGSTMMIGGAAIDITERKRLEKEIQEISEREKRKIGQDLHDGLGQYLTGIACMARALQQRLEDKKRPEAMDVAKIANLVNQTISQARDLARGLCPVELEANGLQGALSDLVDQIEKFFNVPCTFECPEPIVVSDSAVAINLYRIAQEATNNAIKHGKATAISIRLIAGHGSAALRIKDNGSGFLKGFVQSKGMGLRVMHYRAGMIGASISIEADPKGGTIVNCAFPFQSNLKQSHRGPRPARSDRLPPAG